MPRSSLVRSELLGQRTSIKIISPAVVRALRETAGSEPGHLPGAPDHHVRLLDEHLVPLTPGTACNREDPRSLRGSEGEREYENKSDKS